MTVPVELSVGDLDGFGEAGISVFAISTFGTDHLLVKEDDLARATETLQQHGHSVECFSFS